MKIFKDLPALVQALPELTLSDWVDLPADAAAQLDAPHQSPPAGLLAQPALRFVVRDANEAPRMGHKPWMPVAVLAQMHWPSPSDAVAWSRFLQAEFGRSQRFVENHDVWDEADLPEPYWQPADASLDQRLAHWYQGLQAHAWMDEEPAQARPFSRAELRLCEWRLGCNLPESLRDYLLHLCAPVEGRPGGGGHARCQTHLIQRTALLHQPLGRGIVAAIEGRDQRIEACALLHIGYIVTVPQAQLQRSNIAFFSGLEQFHTHLSTSIS